MGSLHPHSIGTSRWSPGGGEDAREYNFVDFVLLLSFISEKKCSNNVHFEPLFEDHRE